MALTGSLRTSPCYNGKRSKPPSRLALPPTAVSMIRYIRGSPRQVNISVYISKPITHRVKHDADVNTDTPHATAGPRRPTSGPSSAARWPIVRSTNATVTRNGLGTHRGGEWDRFPESCHRFRHSSTSAGFSSLFYSQYGVLVEGQSSSFGYTGLESGIMDLRSTSRLSGFLMSYASSSPL